MVQLPGYLERVLAGGRDLALVLLPLLNDLRAVRGSALLSEGTLLLLNLKSDQQAQPPRRRAGRAAADGGAVGAAPARALPGRPASAGSAASASEQNLEILATVAQKLEQIATRQPVFQLWWVVGAVIEALRENGLEGGVVGQAPARAWPIARSAACTSRARRATRSHPPVELLNNLLYYVGARRLLGGPRVDRGARLLPPDRAAAGRREHRAGAREPLRAQRQAHADRGRGDPRGPRQGQGRAGHLRAPRRRPARGARLRRSSCCARSATRSGVLGLGELRAQRAGRDRRGSPRSSTARCKADEADAGRDRRDPDRRRGPASTTSSSA